MVDNWYLIFDFDALCNHSCDPNLHSVRFNENDPCHFRSIAIKDFNAGDELYLNYNTFSYDTKHPFNYSCGTEKCYKRVEPLKYLSIHQQKDIVDIIEPNLFKLHKLNYLKEKEKIKFKL